jgi:hypothetical protein
MGDMQHLVSLCLSMHHDKAKITRDQTAYLMKMEDFMNPDSPLVAYKEQQLLDTFNHESKQFQMLMRRFKTYDTDKEVLIGLIIDNENLLSEILIK